MFTLPPLWTSEPHTDLSYLSCKPNNYQSSQMPVLTWPWTTVSHESPALLGATLSISVFPQHLQRLQTTRLPPLSTVKPNAVRPDFNLESLQKVFSPFHTSWPDCFCLFMELIDMYESYDHEALGGVMDRERYKWLKLQQASKTNKNENCWICCLCIYFANYWLVNLLGLARQHLGLGYIQREKNPVLASTENVCMFSLQNLYAGHE